jgi:phosphosulfolactate phosphohydrolase-like enzyme
LNNENKVLGYYKIGHLAMSALLKLGLENDVVFCTDLDPFEKEMKLKFLNDNDW